MRFLITDDFWSLFPDARIGAVIARGLNNAVADDRIARLLGDSMQAAAAQLGETDIATHPAVAPWRVAYQAFGMKPSKFRSSIEGLLRSARNGNVRSINPLVDLYNAVSLKHFLPCGGEDLGAVRGEIRLTRAKGDEEFLPLGDSVPQPPQPGEVIYRDDEGVLCRSWNWREAERTKLTAATTDAFLCIEALPALGEDAPELACEELAALVKEKLGGMTRVEILTRSRPQVEF
jgi:DNA/RNA-binding domain of Phe-tRNA-synthetase-like protein